VSLTLLSLLSSAVLTNGGRVRAVHWYPRIGCSRIRARAVPGGDVFERFGPADWVTLVRAVLTCAVAALTVTSFVSPRAPVTALAATACVALLLDWVDGQVARRTRTASEFGAAFDMEVDAFLVLVLSVFVARWAGPWVLLAGSARYLLLVAARWRPWLRASMPERYWAKVVAATQGIVLAVAAADVLPRPLVLGALVGALVLLAVSFGHQVWWLRRNRQPEAVANGCREQVAA
jgi:phosphatidylglycerophosphate synthase